MGNQDNDIKNLKGKILLSTLSISHEYLNKSMIYLCSHDEKGAMGVIVNKAVPEMNMLEIFKKSKIDVEGLKDFSVNFGGIEEIERCFILHSDDYMFSNSSIISGRTALTINEDVFNVVSAVGGPQKKLVCMGCCVWEAEQLEDEVAASCWVAIDSDEALIFGDPKADKWSKALLKIGSRTNVFSDLQGNA